MEEMESVLPSQRETDIDANRHCHSSRQEEIRTGQVGEIRGPGSQGQIKMQTT